VRVDEPQSDDALACYWAVLSIDAEHTGALNNLGVIALDARDYANAERWFRRAAQIEPANAKTHFLLAKTFLGKGNREAAQTEIDAAVRLKPDQPEFRTLSEQIKVGPP